MTSEELYAKLRPIETRRFPAQLLADGLSVSTTEIFSTLIKDAARCNGFNSDVYYSLKEIDRFIRDFRRGQKEKIIWVGFRKLGTDNTSLLLNRISDDCVYLSLSQNYFALYSITLEHDGYDFYKLVFNEYGV